MTVIIKINGIFYKNNFKNFTEFFNNINNFIDKKSNILYTDIFKSDITQYKCSNNYITMPSSHCAGKNLWLIKPTDLCGGRCIQITDNIDEMEKMIKRFFEGLLKSLKKSLEEDQEISDESESESSDNEDKKKCGIKYRASTVLIQKYIEKPMLYKGRKFDIRMWVLINHKMDVYLFKEGHLKVSSSEYNINTKDKFVHITNYSLQKYNNNFAKFEQGNEVSFKDFQV